MTTSEKFHGTSTMKGTVINSSSCQECQTSSEYSGNFTKCISNKEVQMCPNDHLVSLSGACLAIPVIVRIDVIGNL